MKKRGSRHALITDGTLGKDATAATVLEPRGLPCANAGLIASYQPGDIVALRKFDQGHPRAGIGYRVEAVDDERGTARLVPGNVNAHDWPLPREDVTFLVIYDHE
jgi:hypothetical protein